MFACVALGFAGPTHADQVIEGVYNYTPQDGDSGSWEIWPSCVPVVGDLREPLNLPVACRLHMSPSTGLTGGDAILTGGLWQFSTPKKEGMRCPDGSWAPTVETFKFEWKDRGRGCNCIVEVMNQERLYRFEIQRWSQCRGNAINFDFFAHRSPLPEIFVRRVN